MRLIYTKDTTAIICGARSPIGAPTMSLDQVFTLSFIDISTLDAETMENIKANRLQGAALKSALEKCDVLGCSVDFETPAEMLQLSSIIGGTAYQYLQALKVSIDPRQTH